MRVADINILKIKLHIHADSRPSFHVWDFILFHLTTYQLNFNIAKYTFSISVNQSAQGAKTSTNGADIFTVITSPANRNFNIDFLKCLR